MNDRPPLWKVVDQAWWGLVNTDEPHCDPPASDQAACVIRAVRDWLVPEEAEPWGKAQSECQRLRDLLTAEADRAVRGDQSTSENN